MQRRNFLSLSASGIALTLLPWSLTSCDTWSKWSETLAMPTVLGRFCSTEELKKIGSAYLSKQKDEASEDALEEKLLIQPDRKLFDPASAEALQDYLSTQIENDFIEDNTMILDGWVISRTEARQCALYTLTSE